MIIGGARGGMKIALLRKELNEVTSDHETKALRISETDPAPGRDRGTTFLYYRGAFRVYFNRKEDKPRVVSIDNGSHAWEINCKTLKIHDVKLKSEFRLYAESPDPCFWLEGHGAVTIDGDGNATIV